MEYGCEPFQVKIIHKDTGELIYLAKQQSICLMLLAQGRTAKDIAEIMQLSKRTIEHYLARIRKLLGCPSNISLIALYGSQLATYSLPVTNCP
jgi:shikimate kinase